MARASDLWRAAIASPRAPVIVHACRLRTSESQWPAARIAAISPPTWAAGRLLMPCPVEFSGESDGRSQKESVAHEAREPPLGGRADGTRVRRGQGVGRAPPAPSYRSQVGQIPWPADPGGED